jgi:tetratricopeptide (TPR) repeat protein
MTEGNACRLAMPHLSDLQQKFKDKGVAVIAQNVWENSPEAVAAYLQSMEDKMKFRVALDLADDNGKGKMGVTWMDAAGQAAVPAAFVVNGEGKIAWIGHPGSLKEKLIQPILDGSFDLKVAAEQYALALANEPKMQAVWKDLRTAMENNAWDKAVLLLDELDKLALPDGRPGLGILRFQMLLLRQEFPAAAKLALQLSDAHPDEAMMQNQLAWELATHDGIVKREVEIIEKIAQRANDAAGGKDPAILDTLARALFMRGKKDAAIELQEKAVKLAQGVMKGQLQRVLNSYRQGTLPEAE